MNTAEAARRIVEESLGGPPGVNRARRLAEGTDIRDVLAPSDRAIVGTDAVRLNLPLRDPVECRRHLAMIEDVAHRLQRLLDQNKPDRSLLFSVRGELRSLNKKLNAYRTGRRD